MAAGDCDKIQSVMFGADAGGNEAILECDDYQLEPYADKWQGLHGQMQVLAMRPWEHISGTNHGGLPS